MNVSVRQLFGIDSDMEVPAFSEPDEHVPDVDVDYIFDRETTLAILAGFARNRRVMVTGYHGTGKSTHIEQVAGPAELAVRARQPRQPHQPHRPRSARTPSWCATTTR
jgi:MoxR-like ATPase